MLLHRPIMRLPMTSPDAPLGVHAAVQALPHTADTESWHACPRFREGLKDTQYEVAFMSIMAVGLTRD